MASIMERRVDQRPPYFDRIPTKLDWIMPFLIALISLVISGYVGYNHNDRDIVQRVQNVETQQKNDGERLNRIENKLDKVLDNQSRMGAGSR